MCWRPVSPGMWVPQVGWAQKSVFQQAEVGSLHPIKIGKNYNLLPGLGRSDCILWKERRVKRGDYRADFLASFTNTCRQRDSGAWSCTHMLQIRTRSPPSQGRAGNNPQGKYGVTGSSDIRTDCCPHRTGRKDLSPQWTMWFSSILLVAPHHFTEWCLETF